MENPSPFGHKKENVMKVKLDKLTNVNESRWFYLQQKTRAYLAEMGLLFVVLLLQVSEKLPLELVNVFYVAENGLQLQLGEHVWMFAALADVTLKESSSQSGSSTHQQEELVGRHGVTRQQR